MGKKKKQEEIKVKDIKSMQFNINLSVPKEAFDELLRRMAHLESKDTPKEDESKDKKEKKKG